MSEQDAAEKVALVTVIERVRCYSCNHEFAANRNRLSTGCPKCGSDSFVRSAAWIGDGA